MHERRVGDGSVTAGSPSGRGSWARDWAGPTPSRHGAVKGPGITDRSHLLPARAGWVTG